MTGATPLQPLKPTPRVAIVDDDHYGRTALSSLLRSCGIEAAVFDCAQALLNEDLRFTCVVSDIQMPSMTGLELARELKSRKPDLPIVLLTAFPEEQGRREAREIGVARYIEKPFFTEELLAFLKELMPSFDTG